MAAVNDRADFTDSPASLMAADRIGAVIASHFGMFAASH